ncbi:MAG: acetyl-CoA carboxylase biotin carboxyl carrier protein subunit [Bacteroidales bacterium]|nr:acetyl-CoA carboxylase biotin carboxyl carrier protein subunit [Bacteroidales bacterium]MBN2819210.1 acetyl-CoA carboxylase biotin carboxyl carrier protein subunit [Bacteroidales bacterium]
MKSQKKIKAEDTTSVDSEKTTAKYQTLIVHGTKFRTLFNKKYENRKKWSKPNENHILSFIPGTILKVMVKEGQKVSKDTPLLILEAMKMENTLFAPISGKVKKVNVKANDKVPKGTLLIELE